MSLARTSSLLSDPELQPARPSTASLSRLTTSARASANTLEQVLEHLRAQKWSAEIVVVDDGSRDDTANS